MQTHKMKQDNIIVIEQDNSILSVLYGLLHLP